ncbi:TIGR02679 domain-containing protein [Streptomyces sp. NPDC097617]|uniref:TIGR02679 domain-containing protein n=1 Tax=Streptomyces sp. NPDC097617 TaxID=3366091 RepID=UPI0038170BFE
MDEARLRRLLGGADLVWLVERVRRRLERGQPLTGALSLAAPTPAERAAAERLLGRAPGAGRALTVRLDAVDAMLVRSGISPEGLAAAVTALTGRVVPLEEARRSEEQAWREAYAPLTLLAEDLPHHAAWAVRARDDGLVRRLARTPAAARPLLEQTVRVLRELPVEPARSLPVFAAEILGSAHALDDGTPVATLALSGARALTGHPEGAGAAWRRAAWASAGLLRDDVSSTVLTLNLRGTPALDWMADGHVPWRPWRYTAHDYREAVAAAGPDLRPLSGKPTPSPWEPDLAFALAEHALRVEEETVLDALLADLEG